MGEKLGFEGGIRGKRGPGVVGEGTAAVGGFRGPPNKKRKKVSKKRERDMDTCRKEDILEYDVAKLLATLGLGSSKEEKPGALPAEGSEIVVEIKELASTGEGLAVQQQTLDSATGDTNRGRIYIVPLTVPGDVVRVKVFRHNPSSDSSACDLLEILTPGSNRDDELVRCKYFGRCAGCQLQMLPYEVQLAHKRTIVEKAFANWSNLRADEIPLVENTVGSPLQYGYRTKLTPHFDAPAAVRRKNITNEDRKHRWGDEPPSIGFGMVGRRTVLDIEDCPLGTEVVRKGFSRERERVRRDFKEYKAGATILLRESTKRIWKSNSEAASEAPPTELEGESVLVREDRNGYVDYKTCITNTKADSVEYVGDDYVFRNPADAFFQNNNSILPRVTGYIRERIVGGSGSDNKSIKYLVDAYCGSGLFTIALSSLFMDNENSTGRRPSSRTPSPFRAHSGPFSQLHRQDVSDLASKGEGGASIGIDISDASIRYARRNMELNRLSSSSPSSNRIFFYAADAHEIFAHITRACFSADETAVVIDPPRKGCSTDFLRQLMEFGPRRIAYVSCNVHTQARDVGMLVKGRVVEGWKPIREKKDEEWEIIRGVTMAGTNADNGNGREAMDMDGEMKLSKKMARYKIESLCGFDFFPQTSHVEGVAILDRVD